MWFLLTIERDQAPAIIRRMTQALGMLNDGVTDKECVEIHIAPTALGVGIYIYDPDHRFAEGLGATPSQPAPPNASRLKQLEAPD